GATDRGLREGGEEEQEREMGAEREQGVMVVAPFLRGLYVLLPADGKDFEHLAGGGGCACSQKLGAAAREVEQGRAVGRGRAVIRRAWLP
ncbi:MAG: hypothetical protein PUI26_11420, partial [Selenomonadaceae bacterium]|nr:hypothetical protein [Selenomonadaceae bacterium]